MNMFIRNTLGNSCLKLLAIVLTFQCSAKPLCTDIFDTTGIKGIPHVFRTHYLGNNPPDPKIWSLAEVFATTALSRTFSLNEWSEWEAQLQSNPNWDVNSDFPIPESRMPDAVGTARNLQLALLACYEKNLSNSSAKTLKVFTKLIRASRSLQEKLPNPIRMSGHKLTLFEELPDIQDYRFWIRPGMTRTYDRLMVATQVPLKENQFQRDVPSSNAILHIFKGKNWKDHAYKLKSIKNHFVLSVTSLGSGNKDFLVVSMPYQEPNFVGGYPEFHTVVLTTFRLDKEQLRVVAQAKKTAKLSSYTSPQDTNVKLNEDETLIKLSFSRQKIAWVFDTKTLDESLMEFESPEVTLPFKFKRHTIFAKHPTEQEYAVLRETGYAKHGTDKGTRIKRSKTELQIWNSEEIVRRIELPKVISRWIEEDDEFDTIEHESKWDGAPGRVTYSSKGNFILCSFFSGGVLVLNRKTGAFVDFIYQRRETRLWGLDPTPGAGLDEESGVLTYHGFREVLEYGFAR